MNQSEFTYIVTYVYHKRIANKDFKDYQSALDFYTSKILCCRGIYKIDAYGNITKLL